MSGPKEYWLKPQKGTDCQWSNLYPDGTWGNFGHLVHVIEYSALEKELERSKKLVGILLAVQEQSIAHDDNCSWYGDDTCECNCGSHKIETMIYKALDDYEESK